MTLGDILVEITGAVTTLATDFGLYIGAGIVMAGAARLFRMFVRGAR